jgi:hypothetical protein
MNVGPLVTETQTVDLAAEAAVDAAVQAVIRFGSNDSTEQIKAYIPAALEAAREAESLYVSGVTDWDAISKAYDLVKARVVNRVDGNGWKLYRVGELIRVDLDGAKS